MRGIATPVSGAEARRMVRLYRTMPLEAVARKLGLGRRVVTRVLREHGVEIRPAGFQPGGISVELGRARRLTPPAEDAAAMAELYPARSLRAVARRVGYCTKVVRRVLDEQGVPIRPPGPPRREGAAHA